MYIGNKIFTEQLQLIENKEAGYDDLFFDWFCSDKGLKSRAEKLIKKVNFLLKKCDIPADKVSVSFKNCCPCVGKTYDRIYINSLEDDNKFVCLTPKLGFTDSTISGKCELYLSDTNVEIEYDNYKTFKSNLNEELISKIREELQLN